MPAAPRPLSLDGSWLPRLTRDDARFAAALVDAARSELVEEACGHAAALLRAPVQRLDARAALGDDTRHEDLVLHVTDGARSFTLSVDPRSARALAARVLGVDAPEPSTGPIGARVRGAVTALALAVLRRLGSTPRAFHVVDHGPHGPRLTVTAQALVGSEPVELRVTSRAADTRARRLTSDGALRDVPLTLGLVDTAGFALTMLEVEALIPGRALALGASALASRPLALLPPRAERGAGARVAASGARDVVLTGSVVAAPLAMDPDSSSPLEPALREAELVVRVELASVTLPIAAWAALREGDVVTTDAPVGRLVRLRAGGVAFAEGELCELEGQLAVRITRRAQTDRDPR